MNVKRIIRRMTDNDYLFTIFTKIMAVFIGLIASFYSNRFLGPQRWKAWTKCAPAVP